MINLDHVHFQHKTVIYFVQTFGNIYTIVPFCKHALRVFHAIAWLILLAHAQTNFPPVPQAFKKKNWWETNRKACGLIFQNGGSHKPNYI
jgi:hypothetical protein